MGSFMVHLLGRTGWLDAGSWSLESVPHESTTFALSNRVRSVTLKVKAFLLFDSNLIYQLALRVTIAYRLLGLPVVRASGACNPCGR